VTRQTFSFDPRCLPELDFTEQQESIGFEWTLNIFHYSPQEEGESTYGYSCMVTSEGMNVPLRNCTGCPQIAEVNPGGVWSESLICLFDFSDAMESDCLVR
jgi:hypothetical protein